MYLVSFLSDKIFLINETVQRCVNDTFDRKRVRHLLLFIIKKSVPSFLVELSELNTTTKAVHKKKTNRVSNRLKYTI